MMENEIICLALSEFHRGLRTISTIAVHAFSQTSLGKRGSALQNSQDNIHGVLVTKWA